MTEHDHTEPETDDTEEQATEQRPMPYEVTLSDGTEYTIEDVVGWNLYAGFVQFFKADGVLGRAVRADMLESFAPVEPLIEVDNDEDVPDHDMAFVDMDGDGEPDDVDTGEDDYDPEADADSQQ